METSFKLSDLRKALDYVQTNGGSTVRIRPTSPLGLATALEFEFQNTAKAETAVSLAANGKMTRVVTEDLK